MRFHSTPLTIRFLASLALLFSLSSCSKEIKLAGPDAQIASQTVTRGGKEIIYPDDAPSVPDGKSIWQSQNCATCHSDSGSAVPGKSTINLADKTWMRKQKPVDQYEFLWFGKDGSDHPTLQGKISRHEAWNLVFYTRSLADPPLGDKELGDVDLVFKSNCAVCHGPKGYGDGPLAHNLEPVPANFKQFNRFYDRSDAVLWDHIANGIKWEGMPNFLGKIDKAKNVKFDEQYIWKLVQYVRHFQESTVPTLAANPQTTSDNKAKSPSK